MDIAAPSKVSELTINCVQCRKPQTIKVKDDDIERFKTGNGHIQAIFPYLLPAEREMFLSRICGNCWEELFIKDADDEA